MCKAFRFSVSLPPSQYSITGYYYTVRPCALSIATSRHLTAVLRETHVGTQSDRHGAKTKAARVLFEREKHQQQKTTISNCCFARRVPLGVARTCSFQFQPDLCLVPQHTSPASHTHTHTIDTAANQSGQTLKRIPHAHRRSSYPGRGNVRRNARKQMADTQHSQANREQAGSYLSLSALRARNLRNPITSPHQGGVH